MPHVLVKMHSDRNDAEKQALADAITAVMHDVLGHDAGKTPIGLEEIEPSDAADRFRPNHASRRPDGNPVVLADPRQDRTPVCRARRCS